VKTLSLKLPDELHVKLATAAKQTKTTKSDVVRQALDSFLNDEIRVRKGSLLDLADDLIGCVDGPGDLSCNPDHMRDFGK